MHTNVISPDIPQTYDLVKGFPVNKELKKQMRKSIRSAGDLEI
jgi:hypothetical protein